MNLVDTLICEIDAGLRSVFANTVAARPVPSQLSADVPSDPAPSYAEESARLMRVNHVGEVCAQALYRGQMAFARESETRSVLEHAALEERDHLAWCAHRVQELGGHTSVLSPLFYVGAWTLGVVSGLAGDRWSMGFLVETERQVEAHLDGHLERIAEDDQRSRAIVTQMRADEIEHGNAGETHGAATLPAPVRAAMRLSSRVMTSTTYWI